MKATAYWFVAMCQGSVGERFPAQQRYEIAQRSILKRRLTAWQNHQSNCRFWAKMALIVGIASWICMVNGVDKIPAVRETLGRLAALEATIGGLVHGQIEAWEEWPEGYAAPNRRMMYAALNWCQEHHTEIIDILRTLMGGAHYKCPRSSRPADPD